MDAVGHIEELQSRLGLVHWLVLYDGDWHSSGTEDARVEFQQDERIATIHVEHSVRSDRRVYHLIRHEMLHILMTDLEFIASNGRSTDVMELYNREQERVINQLSRALEE